MSRHSLLSVFVLLLPVVHCGELLGRAPSILVIMSDDHTAEAIGCYGGRLAAHARTPHIDRLAERGALLRNVFCTNSICVPSRASILTGQYSHRNGVRRLADALDPERDNVAKRLREAGYETAIIGKWHLKSPPSGFDHAEVLRGQGRYHDPVLWMEGRGEKRYDGFSTDVITDLSLDWLKNRPGKKDKPFALFCHYKNCHEAWQWAKRHASLHEGVTFPEPESLFEDLSHRSDGSRTYGFTMETMAGRLAKRKINDGPLKLDGLSPKERRRAAHQRLVRDYLRCVAAIDENVGRLVEWVDASGAADDTVVIYTSDQGYFLGEHNYIDKRWMFEESLRMPFVVRYPREIRAATLVDDIVLNVDFAPLFLDWAGADVPESVQGRTFRANLRGATPGDWRTSMYYRYWEHGTRPAHYGIRTATHKLIFFYGLDVGAVGRRRVAPPTEFGWELYDLRSDPRELVNVYDHDKNRELVSKLKKELARLKVELGDDDSAFPELLRRLQGAERN